MKKFVILLFVAIAASRSFAQPLPSGFVDTLVTAVSAPTALAVTPDGRTLITTQPGNLMIFKGGALPLTTALAFNTGSTGNEPKICAAGEQGLLGVAVDPAFTSNHYVYLFYTARNGSACTAGDYTASGSYNAANTKVNRVSRFIFGSGVNADIIDPASELILIDRMPSRGTNHNAGDVHFGKDGHLYVSIGDGGTDYSGVSPGSGGTNDASRDTHVLTGKLLRITRDGGIPADNPFTGAASGRCNVNGATTAGNHCQETFAWGLRNPFRFAMDPNASGTHAYINDVGQNLREEVDELQHGADYGWNCREATLVNSTTGPCNPTPPGMVDPIFSYGRSVGQGVNIASCASITGGAFVPNGVWPAAYNNTYLLADFICGGVFLIPTTGSPAAPIAAAATFTGALGGSSATSLRFAPDGNTQALYYTTYAAGGQVRKIAYSATVDISFTSIPSGLRLKVNGALRATPFTVTTAVGAALAVAAPDQNLGSNGYRFNNWSDGGARSHIFTAPSAATTLNATLSAGAFVPSLDVDNDGTSGADSDGVLLLRYLFGLRGSALVANASGSGAERDATAIASYLAALGLALDVDNNQSVGATTDGLLVLRYLLGLRGSALISNAVAADALRTKAVDIEAFLANLLP